LGGGKNFGEFSMPQINQKGLVIAVRDSLSELYWLGSFFEEIRDKNSNIIGVTTPSGDETLEGAYLDSGSSFKTDSKVLRTKNTTNFQRKAGSYSIKNSNPINWFSTPTTNIVEIGADVYKILHFGNAQPNFAMDVSSSSKTGNDYWETLSKATIIANANNSVIISSETKVGGTLAAKSGDSNANLYRDISSISLNSLKSTDINFNTFKGAKAATIGLVSLTASNNIISWKDVASKTAVSITQDISQLSLAYTDKDGKNFSIVINSSGISITADSSKDINIVAKNINLNAANVAYGNAADYYVLSSVLKDILDALFSHGHITNTGATQGPAMVSGSNPTPLSGMMTSKVQKMSSKGP
jgi:hypothetical protein